MQRKVSPARITALLVLAVVLALATVVVAKSSKTAAELLSDGYGLASHNLTDWAASYFQDATQAEPTNLEAWLASGLVYYVSGREPQAEVAWREAERLGEYAASSLLGDALRCRGDLLGAEAAYRRALEQQPNAVLPLLGLALVSEQRDDLTAARDLLEKIMVPPPDGEEEYVPIPEAFYHLGRLHLASNDIDLALEVLGNGAKAHPHNSSIFLLMGQAYEKQGKEAEAIHAYEWALQVSPDLEDVQEALNRIRGH